MSFNASQVIVAGPAVNSVLGDQFNVTGGVVHIGQRVDDEPTKYDNVRAPTVMYLHELNMIVTRCFVAS